VFGEDREPPRRRVPRTLLVILLIQTGLSLLLMMSNTAFGDEALYMWAGHIELTHWFSHMATPATTYPDYLSGAPQLYPPLAAMADSLGGLIGARILSLCFMLGTTILLYSTANRLSSRKAALFSCALWLGCEPNLRMGAYATFDPMAIFCICLALWAAVKAAGSKYHAELIGLSAVAAAIGCVTAYSYAIYLPAVVIVGYFAWARERGAKRSLISLAGMIILLGALLALIPTLLHVWHGVSFTTIHRDISRDHETRAAILQTAWSYAGLVTIVSAAAAVIAIAAAKGRSDRLFRCALLGAAFLVPVYQILIAKTGWALDKHLAAGMWCVVLVAGMGLASISWPRVKRPALVAAACVALAVPVFDGWFSAYGIQRSWPDMSNLVAAVRPLTASAHGTLYVSATPSYLDYYTWPSSLRREVWKSSISLDPSAWHGSPVSYYRSEIRQQSPGLVVLFFPGYLKAQSLPHDVFQVLRGGKGARDQLARVGAVNSLEPGAYYFALALQQDPRYRLVSSGPVNSGYGSFGLEPSTFFIWQRTKAAAARPPADQPAASSRPSARPHPGH
jgi:4-amino-4-deoxy-L-arabinose transferase-like glycosyltransferase